MKVKHILKNNQWVKEVDERTSFLLGNKIGDYLWLSDNPESRYQGWFVTPPNQSGGEIYKVIEDIRPMGRNRIETVENYFSKVRRKGDGFEETFIVSENEHKMRYQLKEDSEVELILDMRHSYSNAYPEYIIEWIDDKLLIKTGGEDDLFLAIKGFESVDLIRERFVRHYSIDKKRNSPPFEKAVFKALSMRGKDFFFSASEDREEALNQLDTKIEANLPEEEKEPVDFVAAKKGLSDLSVNGRGIYAGYPWFFQFWKRDEAISLRGLRIIDPEKAEKLFWSLLEEDKSCPAGKAFDGIGWTFKRAFLFLNDFNQEEEKALADFLRKEVDFEKSDELTVNGNKETWMDSIPREGARIEIQALKLNMYKLGRLIDPEKQDKYQSMESELKKKVRSIFWDGNILADGYFPKKGVVDKTVRPNIFLAYYIYPDLLSEKEWVTCFRRALYELWLDWGGLASISKESPRFNSRHTGENPQSYHQGDSWFFVNNLAAISMNRLDDGKFSYEIKKILEASRENLMWKGAVGHHSEISSAEILKSEGAVSQAWSFATYLEALYEIFKINNFSWS